jgi:16S rRNA (adenine1518-N6/adenine1519-N6)-dimethyltransferase
VQRYCRVKHRFDINPKSFTPPPKVNTSVVHLTRHVQLEGQDEVSFAHFERITTAVFNSRRRRLRHGLRSLFNNDMAATDAFLLELELSEATAMHLSNQDLMRVAWAYKTYAEMYPERVTAVVEHKPRRMKQGKADAPPS